jgi:hypothetical protein
VRFSAISRTNYQPLTNKFLLDFCSKIVFQQPLPISLKTPEEGEQTAQACVNACVC